MLFQFKEHRGGASAEGNHTPDEDHHHDHHYDHHHHDHYDSHHDSHHGGYEHEDEHHHDAHNADHEAALTAERRKMEEERKAFEAAKAELQLERERLHLEAQKELAVRGHPRDARAPMRVESCAECAVSSSGRLRRARRDNFGGRFRNWFEIT